MRRPRSIAFGTRQKQRTLRCQITHGAGKTAHFIGGCVIGDSPETGAIDPWHRLYGHPGLHVVDGSDVNPPAQIDAVRQVISEVISGHDGDPPPELLVVNKVDAASDLMLAKLRHGLPGAVFVSARTGDGIDALRGRMAELAAPTDTAVDVVIPYDRGDLVARMHADGRVQQAEHNSEGTRIKARVPVALAASLRQFATD